MPIRVFIGSSPNRDFSSQKINKKLMMPRSGERLIRWYTKYDFMVDEGKGRLNPSRDKTNINIRRAPQKEGGGILCDLPPV